MSKRTEPKLPHIVKLLELFDAGERDYAVLASACGMTRKSVAHALHAYGRTKKAKTEREYLKVRVPRALYDAAEERGVPTNVLVTKLIYIIAKDDLLKAVLDDEDTWAEAA
jgi:hypothetical protein